MGNTAPVTKLANGDARNTTDPAISSASDSFIGVRKNERHAVGFARDASGPCCFNEP